MKNNYLKIAWRIQTAGVFCGLQKPYLFYATPTGHKVFEKALSLYKKGKGSVRFPLDEPFPLELIKQIVKFRIKENRGKINT